MPIIKKSINATLCLNNCEAIQTNFMQMLVTMQYLAKLIVNVKSVNYLDGLSLIFAACRWIALFIHKSGAYKFTSEKKIMPETFQKW